MSIQGIFRIDEWDFERESILKDLPADQLAKLMERKTEHPYKRGEVIFREGGYPLGIYFIVKGKVKKYKSGREGVEQIIYVAKTGELLGYHALLSGDQYPDSAAVIEESVIACIPKEDFLEVLYRSELLMRRLLKTLSHEFSVLANSLTILARRSVRERLALQLVVLREKYKGDFAPGEVVEIDLSRDDLAGLVGTARENVVRTLSEFKGEGILETRGRKIIVHDVKKLVAVANFK
jgi:CRP-like cAMP-binding protein